MEYLLFDPDRPLPPYTLYLCSEQQGRWGIVPNLAPCGRWTLQDEIERARAHSSDKQSCDFWYEVAERGETRYGGKTVFSTRIEPGVYVQFGAGQGFFAHIIGRVKEIERMASGNTYVLVAIDYPYPAATPLSEQKTEYKTLATSLHVISAEEFTAIHEQAVRDYEARKGATH